MKQIVIITTGGTIAMVESTEGNGVKPQDPAALQSVLPLLTPYAQTRMEHILNLPSPHITPQEMYLIAQKVTECLAQIDTDGVVITHGTDTLEETAFFLDLVIQSDKPVVVTGAMRSHNELGADGPYNLVNAVRVAAHDQAKGLGTLVVFNDEIHTARQVTKTHTSNVATFQSPALGPIGHLSKKDIRFYRQEVVREKALPLVNPTATVALIKAAAGMDDSMIQWAIKQNYDGIVIEALGQGNLPPAMLPGIRQSLKQNIPIVLVSRCFNGSVQDIYAYVGGGKQLKEMGVIFASDLSGQKARIKLMLSLELNLPISLLKERFEKLI
ncbi:asparaginase [Thermoflavimicrobium daqui]|uniref:asparaginase n=1 Tax=Thermoflavimicrobium daqui TaxID=2137476 RepID=A0A364K2S9_9BACL|nr:asparaginase [Thermoflavimicrobium daqui]RAL22651.1 L-asparaginase [Thermoflavimicrobium daqui]